MQTHMAYVLPHQNPMKKSSLCSRKLNKYITMSTLWKWTQEKNVFFEFVYIGNEFYYIAFPNESSHFIILEFFSIKKVNISIDEQNDFVAFI